MRTTICRVTFTRWSQCKHSTNGCHHFKNLLLKVLCTYGKKVGLFMTIQKQSGKCVLFLESLVPPTNISLGPEHSSFSWKTCFILLSEKVSSRQKHPQKFKQKLASNAINCLPQCTITWRTSRQFWKHNSCTPMICKLSSPIKSL